MNDPMLPLPGLSPVSGKTVVAKFDGGLLSSDGGVLLLREVERHLRVADRLAACMVDPSAADLITHSLADMSGRRPLSRVSLRFCEHLGRGHVYGLFMRKRLSAGLDG